MKSAPLPTNEAARLQSLQEHQLLDTLPEEVYDDITRIASEICGTPISLITLLDENRQWFKSKHGVVESETPREQSFCAHAILNPDDIFIVPDARYDERFHDNPLTIGETNFVFYAGVPVKDANGHPLGSLCVIDHRPRELSEQKIESLKALAKLVSVHFDLRKTRMELDENKSALQKVQTLVHQMQNSVDTLVGQQVQPQLAQQLALLQQSVASLKAVNTTN